MNETTDTVWWVAPDEVAPPDDLSAESEEVKGVRLLRMFRLFNESDERLTAIQLDGQIMTIMKHEDL